MPTNAPGSITNTSEGELIITPESGGPPVVLEKDDSWTAETDEEFMRAMNSMMKDGDRVPGAPTVPTDPTLNPKTMWRTQAQTQCQLDRAMIEGNITPTPFVTQDSHDNQMGAPSTQNNSMAAVPPIPDDTEVNQENHTEDHAGETPKTRTQAAEPVDVCSGEFTIEETDLVIPNPILSLAFTRYYRSGAPSFGPFGYNWDHNHNIYLRELEHNVVTRWNGQVHEDRFFQIGSTSDYKPQRGIFEKLEKNGPRDYTLTSPGGIVSTFADPPGAPVDLLGRIPLREVVDRFGNKLIYNYEYVNGLFRVTDVRSERDNHYLRFRYGTCDLLEWVDDCMDVGLVTQTFRTVEYYHDPDIQHLIGVRLPGTTDHPEGTLNTYEYLPITEAYALRHNIVGVIDGENNYIVYNTYEKDPSSPKYSKVIQQIFGDQQYTFDYAIIQLLPAGDPYANVPAYQTLMTAPDGGRSIYTFNYRGDLLDHRMHVTSVTGAFEAVVTTYEYDPQGNRTKMTNVNDGLETNYEYLYSGDDMVDVRLWGKLTKVIQNSTIAPIERILWMGEYDTDPDHYQELLKEWDERAIYAGVTADNKLTVYHYDSSTSKRLEKITFPLSSPPVLPPPSDGSKQTREILIQQDSTTGRITKITSPEGYETVFTYGTGSYDPLSKITRDITHVVLDPKAETLFDYDTLGYLSEETDITGAITEYENNDQGQLEVTTLPTIGSSTPTIKQHYDVNGFISRIEYPKGSFTESGFSDTHIDQEFKRDVYGYPTVDTFGSNTLNPFRIDRANDYRGNVLRTVLPNNTVTISTYDERGSIKREKVQGVDGTFSLREWQYTSSGFVKNVKEGPLLDIITWMEYDVFNVRTLTTFGADDGGIASIKGYATFAYGWTDDIPSGWGLPSMTWFADSACRVTLEEYREFGTDDLMSQVIKQYDERGRLILVRTAQFPDPSSGTTYLDTLFFYDKEDQLVKVIGPHVDGSTKQISEFSYDGLGRLKQSIDPLGNIQNLSYDLSARTVTIERVDQEPGTTSTREWKQYFDARGRMTKLREPNSIDTLFEYDDRNLQTETTLPDATEITSTYGLVGQKLTQTVDPSGLNYTHTWEYDNVYQLSEYTDPSSQSTTYHYDGLGRLLKRILPGNFEFLNEYGNDGRLKSHTQPSTAKTSYNYDTYGRLSSFSATAGTTSSGAVNAVPTHSYTYDALDRLLTANVSSGPAVTRTYDSLGNLLSEINHSQTMSASYDLVGGIVTKDFGSSVTETHTLNLNGFPKTVVRTVSGTPSTLLSNLQMSGPSQLGSASLRGSNTVTTIYDDRRRLNQLMFTKATQTVQCDYRYDLNSRRAIDKLTAPSSPYDRLYGFDAQSRLTTSKVLTGTPPTLTAGLTQADNTTDISNYGPITGTTKTTAYNSGDERISHTGIGTYDYDLGHRLTDAGGTAATTYADGPHLTLGTLDFEIDALGRITKIDSDVTITFDALGRPSILTDGSNPTLTFCYFGEELWLELANGTRDRYITHHPLMNGYLGVHKASPGPSYLCFNDARMNRLAVVNPAGNIVQSYSYDTFGEQIGTPPSVLEPVFGGMRYLASKGVFISRSRLYKPEHGMFLSADPFGYIDSQNLYAYVAHNPANFVDPFGWKLGEGVGETKTQQRVFEPPSHQKYLERYAYASRRFPEAELHELMMYARGLGSEPGLEAWAERKYGYVESFWRGGVNRVTKTYEFLKDQVLAASPIPSIASFEAQLRNQRRINDAIEGVKFTAKLLNPIPNAETIILRAAVVQRVSEMDGSDLAYFAGDITAGAVMSYSPLALGQGCNYLARGVNYLNGFKYVKLGRLVEKAELESIETLGRFTMGPNSAGKYFSPDFDKLLAIKPEFERPIINATGNGFEALISTKIRQRNLNNIWFGYDRSQVVPGGLPMYNFTEPQLDLLTKPVIIQRFGR